MYVLPRATRDFDFVVHLKQSDIDNFVVYFQKNYYCDRDSIVEAIKHQSIFNIIDHLSGYKADFVILKNEEYRQVEFERKVQMDFFGKTIYIVTVEDLLLSKLIWIQDYQSAIQMQDIRSICELETIDWTYVNIWIKKLKIKTYNLIKK